MERTHRYSDDPAKHLRQLQADELILRDERHQLVAELRMTGWTWTRIADVLNISKQAAAKTYGESVDRAFRRVMREAREVAGQTTVDEQLATVEVDAEDELVEAELPGPCMWRGGCDQLGADLRFHLCDWHVHALDQLDTEVSAAPGEPGSVPCPVCSSEEGESCRVLPTWEPTRGKRPHAKRVTAALAARG